MATLVEEKAEGPARGSGPAVDPSGEPAPRGRSRWIVLPLLLIAAALGGTWAYRHWAYGRAHVTTDNATIDGELIPVVARIGGYATLVGVHENERVRAGAVLVRIDPSEYRVRLAQATADLAAARAAAGGPGESGQAEAAVATAAAQRGSLEAQIAAARAADVKARADFARTTELADKQIVSRQQLDAARATAEASDATLQSLQELAAAAGGTVANARAGVRLAAARLQGATAVRDNAQLQLSYTAIVAPASGFVSRKQVDAGLLVQPGQPLMTIVSDSAVWVTANVKETELAMLRVGQSVEIDVDAYRGAAAEGRVESIGAATGAKFALLPPDNATGNFTKIVQRVPVRIAITRDLGADRPLRPGMSVVVHVATAASAKSD